MRVKPQRVRVAVRKGTAPAVGSFVAFKAHLSPPLQPLRPGGYDFARGMYFQKIGASGFVLGHIRTLPPPHALSLTLRYAAWLDSLREAINQRIHVILPGDRGSIASALITGKRNAISEPVREAFYVSSLAHVLAISGFHMAVVAGIVFFVIRALLALSPSLASSRPIKKWAAAGALVAGTFYLLLSGTGVSTQRAFIMVAIVLIGVMLDRPVLTFRTLSVAAFAVLLFAPQAVTQPSFQMSFAATLALIAAYQYGWPWRPDADTSAAARAALWGWREIAGVALASLVAGLATTPYAAFHFHRLAPYGVLANLMAMPVVSAWVMPMGILAVVALPFGFDAPFWRLMGHGIDWMVWVAQWVAHLPGAIGHIHAFGNGPLLLASLGLLLVCLLRTPLRWSGAVLGVVAALLAVNDAAAGYSRLSRWPQRRVARGGWPPLGAAQRARHLRAEGLARGRRRSARRQGQEPARRRALRRARLHRPAQGWPPHRLRHVAGGVCRGLHANEHRHQPALGARRLRGQADRPQRLARARRGGAALAGGSRHRDRRAAGRHRPALVAPAAGLAEAQDVVARRHAGGGCAQDVADGATIRDTRDRTTP